MAATGFPLSSVHQPGTRERSMYSDVSETTCAPTPKGRSRERGVESERESGGRTGTGRGETSRELDSSA
jgi:hypothetical protein